MKSKNVNIFYSLIFLISVNVFVSCEKCKSCVTTETYNVPGGTTITNNKPFEACGDELNNINTTRETISYNGGIKVVTKTVCK
jgi:hypothetical protein